jgi:deoxyribodipyrimidine photolyase-related protein
MCEAKGEAEQTWSSKQRIALFLSAMRHFAAELRARGWPVDYHQTDGSLGDVLRSELERLRPTQVILVEPGEWRVRESLTAACRSVGIPFDERSDRHFLCSREAFAQHARRRKQLRLE